MELHRERRRVMITNALAGAVVAVNVAYLACLGGNAAAYDRIAVVLGGDECSVKREILYRLVAAAVTVLQLLGLGRRAPLRAP